MSIHAKTPATGSNHRPSPVELLALLALLLFVLLSTVAAWTPSHYYEAANILGLKDVWPVLGGSRPARSDEWAVTTAYFQIAAASDFGPRDLVSPYREPLKAFFALPSRDWSMAFKPDLWGFLVLDPARAFALHYALLATAALIGPYLLLRQLGCRREAAAAGAGILFFSQFVQVWWTSNAPALGLAAWPAVIYLWRAGAWLRLPLLAYAVAVWLIGQLYPPFIIATGLALAVAIAAFRPDALAPRRLAVGVAGAASGIALAWLHFADLIPIMAATVYPGERISHGGGVPVLQLLEHVFPYLLTDVYRTVPNWPANISEVAVVGSFLPLATVCFCDHRAFAAWAAEHGRSLAIWTTGLLAMLAWMLLPLPGRFAPGLNLVPPVRMLWAFGLLLTLGLAVAASNAQWRLTWPRVTAFALAVIAAWAVSKQGIGKDDLDHHHFDWRIVVLLLGLIGLHRFAPRLVPSRRVVLGAVVLCSFLTFGRFNPVQSATPIFAPGPSPALESFRAYARANPTGTVIALGEYSATLNGLKIPSINHTLLRPEPAFFRAAYPDLPAAEADRLFNRYEHVMPALVWAPALVQDDVVAIPPDPFAIPLPVDVATAPPALPAPGEGVIEQAEATALGGGRWGIMVGGWTRWSGVSPDQRLSVALEPGEGRILSATAFRLPRPDLTARGDAARFAAGFGLRLVIETPDASTPVGWRIRLAAQDASGVWALAAPAIAPAAPPRLVWPTPPDLQAD